jgi:uroporphyrinogen decarboxylase
MDNKKPDNSCDRVKRAIGHEVQDRMAKGELCINDAVVRQALNCVKVGFEERRAFAAGLELDLFTVLPYCPNPGNNPPTFQDCRWPDLEKWTVQTALFVFAVVEGAFEVGLRLYDDLQFLVMIKRSPLAIREFIAKIERLNISFFRKLSASGVNGIILADDIAYEKGLLINPSLFREYFLPSLARQAEMIRRLGLAAFYHSDGNYYSIIPDLINAGFQGLHCIDHDCGMDMAGIQLQFGDRLCLWGHLNHAAIKQAHNPNSLREILHHLQKLAVRKGIILGTNCGLFAGMDIPGLKVIYNSIGR